LPTAAQPALNVKTPAIINAAQTVNNVPETRARAAHKDWGKTGVSSISMQHV
jgi:hypothetical protein